MIFFSKLDQHKNKSTSSREELENDIFSSLLCGGELFTPSQSLKRERCQL